MRLVILNNDLSFLDKAKRYFQKRGCQIHLGENGIDGLANIMKYQPDAIITHIKLDELSGIDLYRMIKNRNTFNVKFYFVSNSICDDELEFQQEKHKIYSEKTAFQRIISTF